MTDAQKLSVCELQDWLMAHGGDSNSSIPNVSPRGNGRWISLFEVWGRGNRATAHRLNIARVWGADELRAYEIAFICGMVKLCPAEKIDEQEREFYFNDPSLSEGVKRARVEHGLPKRKG